MKDGLVFFLGKGHDMRKLVIFFCIILMLAAAPLTASAVSITFDKTTLSTFSYQFDVNSGGGFFNVPSLIGTPNPAYSDLIAMSGDYGWIGDWDNATSGDTAELYIGVYSTADWTGIDNISQTFYNDDDDIWSGGVWVITQADSLVRTSVNLNPSNTATVALDLTGLDVAHVLSYGIVIGANFGGGMQPSPGDQFHMSSSPVPEPATMLLFGTGLLSLAGFRRKFKK